VEVAPAANAYLDAGVLAENGTVAAYATDGGGELTVSVRGLMYRNIRYQFVLVYTVPAEAKKTAVADVSAALADGALPVGEEAGLPLHRFPLEQAADAHAAVEASAVGKVLVDVAASA
jgi:NADPH2:quinone reductase